VVPIIYHAVKKVDTSALINVASKSNYLDMVHHGLRLAPEYATLDLSLSDEDILRFLQVKGSTRLIAHCFSTDRRVLSWDHNYWISAYERARRLGFDVVRLCWPATCLADNFAIHQFRAKVASLGAPVLPLIAYNSGRLGKTSCCFNLTLTPVTHDEVPSVEPKLDAPFTTAAEATRALYASYVFEPMRFYIVGASAGYSLSPAMHMAAYKACGMPHTYRVHQMPTLDELRTLVEDSHFGGCSISLPFKLEVIKLTKSISCHAKAIGAINTLIPVRHLQEDGSMPHDLDMFKERNRAGPVKALYGENSDWIGVRSCIRRGLSPANAVGPRTTALIIGAGGMARAAIYAALKLGVRNIFIFNRTLAHAETLVAHFSSLVKSETSGDSTPRVLPLSIDTTTHLQVFKSREEAWPENFRQPTIIVSCIPTHRLGDNPSPDFTVPPQWLNSPTGGVVLEVRESKNKIYLISSDHMIRSPTEIFTRRCWNKFAQKHTGVGLLWMVSIFFQIKASPNLSYSRAGEHLVSS
jgi:shikimate 5-dehydrogenase